MCMCYVYVITRKLAVTNICKCGKLGYAHYTPPMSTRRNCRVASCRRCEHTRRQSWPSLQFPVLTSDDIMTSFIVEKVIKIHEYYTIQLIRTCSVICYVISYFYTIDCRIVNLVTADGCVQHHRIRRQSSWASCEFMYTPPTRRNSTVSSRRRRRCVLGISWLVDIPWWTRRPRHLVWPAHQWHWHDLPLTPDVMQSVHSVTTSSYYQLI